MSVIDTAKILGELAKKGMTVELQEQIMKLREEALELQEENLQLTKENESLHDQLKWKQKLNHKRALYWCDGDDTPFCPYCWEKNKLPIHLSGYYDRTREQTDYVCQECMVRYTRYAGRGEENFVVTKYRKK